MVGLILTIVVIVMDGVAVAMILPRLTSEFDVEPSHIAWVVNIYQLALIGMLLPMSSISSIIGYRTTYIFGNILFAGFAAVSAMADSLELLLLSRGMQGVAAAGVMGINLALWRLTVPPAKLGRMIGFNATAVALAATAGPSMAGFILAFSDWRYVLALPVPILIVSSAMAAWSLPRSVPVRMRFDFASAALNIFAFSNLFLGLNGIGQQWPVHVSVFFLSLGITAFSFLYLRSRRARYPLMPIDLLALPRFSLSIGASICAFVAQMCVYVGLPFLFHHEFDFSPLQAGLLISTWPMSLALSALVSGRIGDTVDAGLLGFCGLIVLAGGLALLATISDGTPVAIIAAALAVCGIGFGIFQPPNNKLMISLAPRDRASAASGMLGTARLFGQALGTSLAGAALSLGISAAWSPLMAAAACIAALGAALSVVRLYV